MGLMKTMSQSSAELKAILDRLTALESGETFATKEMFESLNQAVESIDAGMNDIFSAESVISDGSNVVLNKDEIIANFKMPESIDLSLYKVVFYVLGESGSISYDSKFFEVNLFQSQDAGIWKLNVVNKSVSRQSFKIFIVKKGSVYVDLFDTIDHIILKSYTNMIIYSGMTTISAGGQYLMPVEIGTAISKYSCSKCEIVSIASNSGVVDGERPYFMSSDVTASVKKVANPHNKKEIRYSVQVKNNSSAALTTNTFVLVSFDMSRGGNS